MVLVVELENGCWKWNTLQMFSIVTLISSFIALHMVDILPLLVQHNFRTYLFVLYFISVLSNDYFGQFVFSTFLDGFSTENRTAKVILIFFFMFCSFKKTHDLSKLHLEGGYLLKTLWLYRWTAKGFCALAAEKIWDCLQSERVCICYTPYTHCKVWSCFPKSIELYRRL